MWNTNILPFITKQKIGKCNKCVFTTNVGANGLLIDIEICFVSDLDFRSLLILLELSMVTHVVLPLANNKVIGVDGFQQFVG
jgi:hypothetical protein